MINKRAVDEAAAILGRMTAALMKGISPTGRAGAVLRRSVGDFLADVETLIATGTIGTELLAIFDQAREAGATLDDMDRVRAAMIVEAPFYDFGIAVKLIGIVFSFQEQCQLVVAIAFVSRNAVEAMMARMVTTSDEVILEIAELLDGLEYRNVISLSASLINHLGVTERQLPRIVDYTLHAHLPSLTIANTLYNDASRSEELIAENSVIHPAFMPRDIQALSE